MPDQGMGHDEHGPAYPAASYRCPICKGDQDRYLLCEYPGCPDGHDQSRLRPAHWLSDTYPTESRIREMYPSPSYGTMRMLAGWAVAIALLLYLIWPHAAPAMDHGFDPSNTTVQWFEALQRPDTPGSCCGKADAYPVGRYELHPELHEVWAWLEDGSAIKYPDGTVRVYFDMSTKIIVPDNKVNKSADDLDNPTDVSWIFMRVSSPTEVGNVYCLILHPSGS